MRQLVRYWNRLQASMAEPDRLLGWAIVALEQRLAAAEHANSLVRRQAQATQAASVRHTDQLMAAEQQIQELLSVRQQAAQTRDDYQQAA